MIDPASVPPVADQENLARYILHSSHLRADQSIKPNAFMPHPYVELSVSRHLSATEAELWSIGEEIARTTAKTLYGRGDIQAEICVRQGLSVVAAPITGNSNHANISGWPTDKPLQKAFALEIAATARFVSKPPE